MKSTPKRDKMRVKIDYDTIAKIQKLGFMYETIPDVIDKMVEHVLTCESWWWDRDQERGI